MSTSANGNGSLSATRQTEISKLDRVVIRFAGDSGDGMQLTGDRFTSEAAAFGNDLSTMPNFPAEIRAPQGTIPGVSSFQVHFADYDILTPGDRPDVLVAMNPAALKANLADVPQGGTIILNTDDFTKRNMTKVGFEGDALTDDTLGSFQVHKVAMSTLTRGALEETGLSKKDAERAKNMFALGLLSWMYHRPTEGTERYLREKFAKNADIAEANILAFRAGWNYGETTESFATTFHVAPAKLGQGTPTGDFVVKGEAELAIQQIPELKAVAGIDLVGPLPPALQNTTLLASGVLTGAQQPDVAHAFVRFLTSPEAIAVIKEKGLDPGGPARAS